MHEFEIRLSRRISAKGKVFLLFRRIGEHIILFKFIEMNTVIRID